MKDLVPFESMTTEQIMKAIGQGSVSTPQLPRLQINRQGDDDQGRQFPVGTYVTYDKNSNSLVYGKPVYFRPFLNLFQYRKYNPKTDNYDNKTILFKNWNEDIIDELGGLKCGKVTGKAVNSLTESERLAQGNIKCFRYIYGTVSYIGTTVENEKITIENLPCLWRTSGVSFRPISDALEALTRENKFMFNHVFELLTKREQTGSNVYYSPTLKVVPEKTVQFTNDDIVLMKQFQELVERENAEVYNKWANVQKKKLDENEKKLVQDLVKPLDADFEEVGIPFNDPIPELAAG